MPDNVITRLAISIGEPAGIGPDALIMLAQMPQVNVLIAFCDPELLYQRSSQLKLELNIITIELNDIKSLSPAPKKTLYVIDTFQNHFNYLPGILDPSTAAMTIHHLKAATLACLDGFCDALITCPIQKSNICHVLPNFMGHTEYLAELCSLHPTNHDSFQPVMLLMNNELKVALVTTHIPLNQICKYITQENIINIAKIIHDEMIVKFKITQPNILITGLNPHAGEDGKLGTEENDIIIPAIQYLQNNNINASGPYSADSLFSKQFAPNDVILAMYHDQGLTGFKARAFNTAANVTLGLPLIRTSVDHGTALDLAGTGNINLNSLEYAMHLAHQLAIKRTSYGSS